MDVKVGLHKEGWVLENWCFWTVMLEETLESPLDCKKIKQVNPKGDKSWIWNDWCWSSSTLASWCKEPTHWKRPWCWERLKAGGEWGDRGWQGEMKIIDSMNMSLSKLWEMVKDREAFPGHEAKELQDRARKKAPELCWADSWGRPWARLEDWFPSCWEGWQKRVLSHHRHHSSRIALAKKAVLLKVVPPSEVSSHSQQHIPAQRKLSHPCRR